MDHPDGPQDALADQARQQNSNLQRLIDTIAQLIAASRELLARLQPKPAAPPDKNEPGP